MPRTSVKSLSSARILLPPPATQECIVEGIRAADDTIAALDAEAEAASAMRSAILSNLLAGCDDNWEPKTFRDVADWSSGSTPKASEHSYYQHGDIPWAVIGDIQNEPLSKTARHITQAGLHAIGGARKIVPSGSVLISMYGSVGRSAVTRIPIATNQAISRGVPNGSVSAEFLFLWINAHERDLSALAKGSAQQNINKRIVEEFPIRVPPPSIQEQIVQTMLAVDETITASRAEVERLRAMRAALLESLLTRKIEIADVEAEVIAFPDAGDAGVVATPAA